MYNKQRVQDSGGRVHVGSSGMIGSLMGTHNVVIYAKIIQKKSRHSGLQIYGGPGPLSHDFKIWPITFQGSGPSGPILLSCEKISL